MKTSILKCLNDSQNSKTFQDVQNIQNTRCCVIFKNITL